MLMMAGATKMLFLRCEIFQMKMHIPKESRGLKKNQMNPIRCTKCGMAKFMNMVPSRQKNAKLIPKLSYYFCRNSLPTRRMASKITNKNEARDPLLLK